MATRAGALRVGLAGFGHGGAIFHAPLIDATPRLRLAAIVTADAGRRALAAERYPEAQLVDRVDPLLGGCDRVDLLVVSTPNRTHVPLSVAALEAGVAVVLDKPVAPGVEEARRVAAAADRGGVPVVPFHNRRRDGDFLTILRLRDEGALGDVWRFESRFERWRPVPREGWRERGGIEDAGGVLYDLGTHLIDQALTLFGPASHVYAELDRRRPGVLVEDEAFVALTHASGVRSHLWAGLAVAGRGPRFRVLGSRAAYTKHGLDPQEDALRRGDRPGCPDWGEDSPGAWGTLGTDEHGEAVRTERGDYPGYYAAVAAALLDGAPVPVRLDDAIAGLGIIEAARQSAAGRRVVAIQP
jgi:predicted dehydrogenase